MVIDFINEPSNEVCEGRRERFFSVVLQTGCNKTVPLATHSRSRIWKPPVNLQFKRIACVELVMSCRDWLYKQEMAEKCSSWIWNLMAFRCYELDQNVGGKIHPFPWTKQFTCPSLLIYWTVILLVSHKGAHELTHACPLLATWWHLKHTQCLQMVN